MGTFGNIDRPHVHLVTRSCFGSHDTLGGLVFPPLLAALPPVKCERLVLGLVFSLYTLLGSSINFNTAGSQIFTSVSCLWIETGRSLEYDPRSSGPSWAVEWLWLGNLWIFLVHYFEKSWEHFDPPYHHTPVISGGVLWLSSPAV